jgi:2-amino-4-hydroxy-6-hydroxymethyldihydropteridine diphosphokinase
MVAELHGTNLPTPEQVLARLLRVEYALGRTREVPQGPRTIDLDLLIYKLELRSTEFLTLPHPRLHERRFVLEPLAELAPNLVHPKLHRKIADLLNECDDHAEVRHWRP